MGFFEDLGEVIENGLDNLFFDPTSPVNRCIDYIGENYFRPIGEELGKSESGELLVQRIDGDIEKFTEKVENTWLEDVVKRMFGVDLKE